MLCLLYCYQSKLAAVWAKFLRLPAFSAASCVNLRYLPERLRILMVTAANFFSRVSLEG